MTDDLIARLRSLARAEHDDLSVADEAADEILRLRSGYNDVLAEDNWEDARVLADRILETP